MGVREGWLPCRPILLLVIGASNRLIRSLSRSDFRMKSESRIMQNDVCFGERDNMKKQDLLTPASEVPASSQESGRKTGDDGDLSYRAILVPIDFSEHSKRTIEYAIRFAARLAAIHVIVILRLPLSFPDGEVSGFPDTFSFFSRYKSPIVALIILR